MSRRNEEIGEAGPFPSGDLSRTVISVGLLGAFYTTVDGCPVALTAGRLRALLAVLALSAGKAVTVDHLASAVWREENRPANVRRSVQTYVARLRSLLGAQSIGSAPTGYVLHTDPEEVDALRFVGLLREASATSDATAKRARLVEALALWRGEPFEGVSCCRLEESEASWFLERYLTALEQRLDLDLAAGRHNELIVELSELAARYPLRESLWRRLLIALSRAGRRAEALARYETIRVRIATELGVDPDPGLQRLYADLLTQRPPIRERMAEPA